VLAPVGLAVKEGMNLGQAATPSDEGLAGVWVTVQKRAFSQPDHLLLDAGHR